eukprot:8016501-Ditylum_brightwellii.AAC.1
MHHAIPEKRIRKDALIITDNPATNTLILYVLDGHGTSSITNNTVPSPVEDDTKYMPALI